MRTPGEVEATRLHLALTVMRERLPVATFARAPASPEEGEGEEGEEPVTRASNPLKKESATEQTLNRVETQVLERSRPLRRVP